MAYPEGLAVDGSGHLWVADMSHNRVLRFDRAATKPNGAPADSVLGNTNFNTERLVSAASLYHPKCILVHENGI